MTIYVTLFIRWEYGSVLFFIILSKWNLYPYNVNGRRVVKCKWGIPWWVIPCRARLLLLLLLLLVEILRHLSYFSSLCLSVSVSVSLAFNSIQIAQIETTFIIMNPFSSCWLVVAFIVENIIKTFAFKFFSLYILAALCVVHRDLWNTHLYFDRERQNETIQACIYISRLIVNSIYFNFYIRQ